jgi:hypothetical protein
MTWLPIGTYRTFPLPILPIPPLPKKRIDIKKLITPVNQVAPNKFEVTQQPMMK